MKQITECILINVRENRRGHSRMNNPERQETLDIERRQTKKRQSENKDKKNKTKQKEKQKTKKNNKQTSKKRRKQKQQKNIYKQVMICGGHCFQRHTTQMMSSGVLV